MLTERLDHLAPELARLAAAKVIAARPPSAWGPGTDRISARLQLSQMQARRELRDTVQTWNSNPRRAAAEQLAETSHVRARLQAAAAQTPAERWASLARALHPRLITAPDWPATAAILQDAHDQGHDVATAAVALAAERPLGDQPARDLRYRLVSRLDVTIDTGEAPVARATSVPTAHTLAPQQHGQDLRAQRSGPRR